ncbi:MAG: ribose-phosphate pyrophosphokinase [Candidatus Bathyarchaeota archaeon]|nr:ribose-phosphate pyrophosphokinase [Candidatus Bathyarchaeota archaeon]
MKIVGGRGSLELARKTSSLLNAPLLSVKTKHFPDGEFYFKFEENVAGEDLLIVQSLYPPQDSRVFELFLMLHTARDLGASSIKVFAPYLAYSRQDERYLDGECLSSRMIAEILEQLKVDSLYTVDVHNQQVLSMYTFPAHNLTASGELAKYFAAKDLKDPLIVSPDDEELAKKRAEYAAKTIDADNDFFGKKRDRYTGNITTYSKQLNVQGRDAIIIDDIISTGKTAANAARILKEQGARKVFVGVSHALLLGDALKTLKESGADEVVGTDSVVNEHAKVSVAPILERALREGE